MSDCSSSQSRSRPGRLPLATDYGHGLPEDEYRRLRRANDRERLKSHFEHRGSPRTDQPSSSAYRNAGLSYDQRRGVSEVRNATRAALGPSFDFDDESCGRSARHRHDYERSRGWTDDTPTRVDAIPRRYLDEFDRKWHEADEDNDADRFLDDHNRWAAWRQPARLEETPRYGEPVHQSHPRTAVPSRRVDSAYHSHYDRSSTRASEYERATDRPPLTSSWSDDEDSFNEASHKRRFSNRFHQP